MGRLPCAAAATAGVQPEGQAGDGTREIVGGRIGIVK
jgi:hypothetical protein